MLGKQSGVQQMGQAGDQNKGVISMETYDKSHEIDELTKVVSKNPSMAQEKKGLVRQSHSRQLKDMWR